MIYSDLITPGHQIQIIQLLPKEKKKKSLIKHLKDTPYYCYLIFSSASKAHPDKKITVSSLFHI